MSQKWVSRLAWTLALLTLLMGLATAGFVMAGRSSITPPDRASFLVMLFILPIYLAVSMIILYFRPENRIGWLFLFLTFFITLATFSREYAIYGYFHRLDTGVWTGVRLAAWGSLNINASFFIWFILLNLLYPDGRMTSPLWRGLAWLSIAISVTITLQEFVRPGYMVLYRFSSSVTLPFTNPTGITRIHAFFQQVEGVAWMLGLLTLLASGFAPVQRYRSGQGLQRQQIKWLAYFWSLAIAFVVLAALVAVLRVPVPEPVSEFFFNALLIGLLAGFPIFVGLALLRYRLYEIDLIIRRTLIYGALTTSLAFVYAGSVILLQQLSQLVTGSTGQSPLAIVVSTLIVAALFSPLRRRLQERIDRRFYRQKYDAARILAEFAETASQETDLDALNGQLLEAVQSSLQPESVSLWLKGTGKLLKELEGN